MAINGKVGTITNADGTEAIFPRTKTSAVSDETGKGLDAILDELGGLQMDLLWENASPAVAFSEQSITLSDITGYKQVLIAYTFLTGEPTTYVTFVLDAKIGTTHWHSVCNQWSLFRKLTIESGTSFKFSRGDIVQNYGSPTNAFSSGLIPFKIFGIK